MFVGVHVPHVCFVVSQSGPLALPVQSPFASHWTQAWLVGLQTGVAVAHSELVVHVANEQNAPTTAAEAATIILDGVRAGKWRILVGQDAEFMDMLSRERPEDAYTADFYQTIAKGTNWKI